MELPKAYNPADYEDKIYQKWEESGLFNPDNLKLAKNAKSFSIVLPPPNVTGTLHLGHAVMLAIQDVMTRYHRMKGDKTLWLPGTDHAGIATQTKVEKILMKEGLKEPKKELGREKFLERVRKFAQESHDTIVNQCKKMGASLDWSREAFTLDEPRALAVRTVFKKMYDDGLIYRGYRIVNWCPRCQSTLADDEVEYKEQKAKIYTFKYSKDFPFAIATTRPETKLGDTAVAVNPKDKRYKKYIGKTFEVKKFAGGLPTEASAKAGPDLKIKVIGSKEVDMKFGTGALGVTPAHSLVDYKMAQENDLSVIKVIGEDGKMTKEAGPYAGLSVLAAREKVAEALRRAGLMEKEEEAVNNLSVCYRCDTPIEPLPSQQWFIDVNREFGIKKNELGIKSGQRVSLKELMQKAVKSGKIKIIPERFKKTYFHWIDNLNDWCISRQIWYGHQIPVYYCKQGNPKSEILNPKCVESIVSVEELKKCPRCGGGVVQDPDTLDTWFSSGLWTFSTLGWPKETADLKTFHPTSVLETGYDILFFWVARMILMTTYVLGEVPFETVYLHGLVRDEQGRKMSKSLGNVIDPLDMVKKYGTDAVRLALLLGNTPGNDMALSEEKIAGFRNFTNKLWNISRFILLNIDKPKVDISKPAPKTLADKWIMTRLENVVKEVTDNIENFNFSSAGEKLREFTWNDLADWYLEIAKVEGNKSEILNYILNTILKLWHPFMPFVTEAVWREMYGEKEILMVADWPFSVISTPSAKFIPTGAPTAPSGDASGLGTGSVEKSFGLIKDLIVGIRTARADSKIEPAKKIDVFIGAGKHTKLLSENVELTKHLWTNIDNLEVKEKIKKEKSWVTAFVGSGVEVYVDLSGAVDLEKEKARITKELEEARKYLSGLDRKLSNQEFVKNAPKEIVEKEKQKKQEVEERIKKLEAQL